VHRQIYPQVSYGANGTLKELLVTLDDGEQLQLDLHSVTEQLLGSHVTVVQRDRSDGGGSLEYGKGEETTEDCHYHHMSNHSYASVSNCDGNLKGIVVRPDAIYVIHPIPDEHQNRVKRSADGIGLHVIYKRQTEQQDFCGIENTITSEELEEDEAGVNEDVYVVGQRLTQESELIVSDNPMSQSTLFGMNSGGIGHIRR
jgi:hypothetical protein